MSEDEKNPLDDLEIAEIYAAGGAMEADRLVLLLQDEGIEAMNQMTSVSKFPSTATQRFLITAPAPDKQRAQALIKRAIDDEIVPADGTFL
jgi:hypothetical protein